MQYAPKQSEIRQTPHRKTNPGAKPSHPKSRQAYKPKNGERVNKYQPKNTGEKESTCSSSASNASGSKSSSLERAEKEPDATQHHGAKVLEAEKTDMALHKETLRKCLAGEKDYSLDLSVSGEDQTTDETQTRVSDEFDKQSDHFSFQPSSGPVSQDTSRKASIDFKVSEDIMQQAPHAAPEFTAHTMSSVAKPFQPTSAQTNSTLMSGLNSMGSINNDFTPSTPYVHKFRTEMCKNWDLYGKCKFGDEVSIIYQICSF